MANDKHQFLRLVTERNDPTLTPETKLSCPFCKATHKWVQSRGCSQTLIGGPFNHFTEGLRCAKCGFEFEREWKENGRYGTVTWLVDFKTRRVLRGVPGATGCRYLWDCKHCGGDVEVGTSDGSGSIWGKRMPDGSWTSNRYKFRCKDCDRSKESDRDRYELPRRRGLPPHPKEIVFPKGTKVEDIRIVEKPGLGFINTGALKRLELKR